MIALPLNIDITLAALIIGLYAMISLGFDVMLQVLPNIFIEEPLKIDGYGFTLK